MTLVPCSTARYERVRRGRERGWIRASGAPGWIGTRGSDPRPGLRVDHGAGGLGDSVTSISASGEQANASRALARFGQHARSRERHLLATAAAGHACRGIRSDRSFRRPTGCISTRRPGYRSPRGAVERWTLRPRRQIPPVDPPRPRLASLSLPPRWRRARARCGLTRRPSRSRERKRVAGLRCFTSHAARDASQVLEVHGRDAGTELLILQDGENVVRRAASGAQGPEPITPRSSPGTSDTARQ